MDSLISCLMPQFILGMVNDAGFWTCVFCGCSPSSLCKSENENDMIETDNGQSDAGAGGRQSRGKSGISHVFRSLNLLQTPALEPTA
jgi:hypothetical protein